MVRGIRIAGALLLLGGCVAAVAFADPPIEIRGPTLVGFFPPLSDEQFASERGASEGLAHLEFALSDTIKCLESAELVARIELTETLRFLLDGEVVTVSIPDESGKRVGAYLLQPGQVPLPVYATAGPSSLQVLLPNAAAKFLTHPNASTSSRTSAVRPPFNTRLQLTGPQCASIEQWYCLAANQVHSSEPWRWARQLKRISVGQQDDARA